MLLLPVAVVVDPLVALTCPNAIAIGLGDESGDDVNDEICIEMKMAQKIGNAKSILMSTQIKTAGMEWHLDEIAQSHRVNVMSRSKWGEN